MPALTELLKKPIRDPNGDAFATLSDMVVRIGQDTYPPVIGLVARLKDPHGSRDVFIPWEAIQTIGPDGVDLQTQAVNLRRFARREGEIVLRDALFDRQVVDVEGRRVVRINDLDLAPSDGRWRLVAVDVSPSGLMRRIVGARLGQRISTSLGQEFAMRAPLIDWAQVVPVANDGEGALRLRVPRSRLELMRPADLARVVEQLTPKQGAHLLHDLSDERAADTIEELEDEHQGQILRAMDPERAADVLEEMEPDEATDALQSVSDEEAADLLRRMDREDASDVRELLGYPEDSAGGIMTTDYISVPDWATVSQVMAALRQRARRAAAGQEDPLPEALMELYVVAPEEGLRPPALLRANGRGGRPRISRPRGRAGTSVAEAPAPPEVDVESEGRLVGRISLRDLLLADPDALMGDISRLPPHVAHPLDNERDVARVIADDDLFSLPVVDDNNLMLGIVTVDDAMDVILPTAWKKRIPRLFR